MAFGKKISGGEEDWKEMVKKEIEHIEKAEVGNPEKPFAKTEVLTDEVVEGFNKGIALKFNCAAIADSAASFFGRDNVGLPGIALHFKVCAVADRADAHKVVDFLNSRGACIKWCETAAPPDQAEWYQKDKCSVTSAFVKALALAKVGYCCEHKLYKKALEAGDAHSAEFLECAICQTGAKIACLSHYVSALRCAAEAGDMHFVHNFDQRLSCLVEDYAKAAGLEAVIPPRLQLGVVKRLMVNQAKAVQGNIFDEPGRSRKVFERAAL